MQGISLIEGKELDQHMAGRACRFGPRQRVVALGLASIDRIVVVALGVDHVTERREVFAR